MFHCNSIELVLFVLNNSLIASPEIISKSNSCSSGLKCVFIGESYNLSDDPHSYLPIGHSSVNYEAVNIPGGNIKYDFICFNRNILENILRNYREVDQFAQLIEKIGSNPKLCATWLMVLLKARFVKIHM
jgi:hypothetical protein